ncbi:MAG: glycosyltransferase family 1 protein [Gemmatimonadaceae bacterium]|nr:glycosyltransferase family 1 protein [Gemmatimonadaceae bacterium]NUQ94001.1 glycosyltransferase family 1 protein [Gemmatimonadaceae bacterium]
MRVLLSTIGSRGDVQPLVALALELKSLDAEVRVCAPPDFGEWMARLGVPFVPIGPELRSLTAGTTPAIPARSSPEQLKKMAEDSVATQFATIAKAAEGCDAIVGATALQLAAPSIAERMGIPYVFAAYCPRVLPSPRHPPIPLGTRGETSAPATADNAELWARDAERWNATWGGALNAHRAALGLEPVSAVRDHVLTSRPWLAADPTLAPWPGDEGTVFQTGAWILRDERPLSPQLERFLEAGDAPVYFGFGSMRAPEGLAAAMIASARALGRRAIVSRGWAELSVDDAGDDWLAIGEVNQLALFPRVAAAVHHGGAGTTTAAALSGVPQVVVPQMYDQHYWAERVDALGIGVRHAPGAPTAESLRDAIAEALGRDVVERARGVATVVRRDGALVAARRVMSLRR